MGLALQPLQMSFALSSLAARTAVNETVRRGGNGRYVRPAHRREIDDALVARNPRLVNSNK